MSASLFAPVRLAYVAGACVLLSTAGLAAGTGGHPPGPGPAGGSRAASPPAPSAAATPAAATRHGIAWHACGHRLQCAHVLVPLNWARPHGPVIALAVIRYLAARPRAHIGSLFVNPGGPGVSGVALVRRSGAELAAWGGGRFNVVSWDPRGTGASAPVRCFRTTAAAARFWQGAQLPFSRPAAERTAARVAAVARRCERLSGSLLPYLSTADTARDLNYLRGLVGDRRLTYVGLSYGTFLGEVYAAMFPRRVRAMVLDSVVDPVPWVRDAEARTLSQASSADQVFWQFVRLCQAAGPRRCPLAGHHQSVAARVATLFRRARRAPIPAPDATPPGRLSYGDLLLSLLNPLRRPAAWPRLAADLEQAVTGNASALETAARPLRSAAGWMAATTSTAIQCADAPARQPLRAWPAVIGRLTSAGHLLGPVLGWWLWAQCAAWQAQDADRYAGPWHLHTRTPVLLIGTRYDPSTGYRQAVAARRLLGRAVLLTVAGYGHPSYQDPSACVDAARRRYLVDLVTPPRGAVCRADQQPFGPAGHS